LICCNVDEPSYGIPTPLGGFERTLSWSVQNGPPAKDFESLAETLASFVTVASIQLAPRRLTRVPGHRSSRWQTTGLHRTMAKVCKSDCEGTFAGTHGNDEVAPMD
jgi:hypothetical protein